MFIDNKYKRIYEALCSRALNRVLTSYTEQHHILPKSLGGSDAKHNLVRLTAREHFVAHLCLALCTVGKAKTKMILACMWFGKFDQTSSYMFSKMREKRAQLLKGNTITLGRKLSEEHKKKISASLVGNTRTLGFKHTEETKRRVGDAGRGKQRSAATRTKMSAWQIGRKLSDETRQKMSEARTGRKFGSYHLKDLSPQQKLEIQIKRLQNKIAKLQLKAAS